jgi:hypothetical protein
MAVLAGTPNLRQAFPAVIASLVADHACMAAAPLWPMARCCWRPNGRRAASAGCAESNRPRG